jgi:hypothetical protein
MKYTITRIDDRIPDYQVIHTDDFLILLLDYGNGRTVVAAPAEVISRLSLQLQSQGGIGKRRVYLRDIEGPFFELSVAKEEFQEIKPCSIQQQVFLGSLTCKAMRKIIR